MSSLIENTVVDQKKELNEKPAVSDDGVTELSQQAEVSIRGPEEPTDNDLVTLRRVADKIPWKVYSVAFVELCERFSFYGTTVVCKLRFFSWWSTCLQKKSQTSFNTLFPKDRTQELAELMANPVRWTWDSRHPLESQLSTNFGST